MDPSFEQELVELIEAERLKNPKRSLRDKYKRRVCWMAHSLQEFIYYAEERLDPERAGKIRNKGETELLKKSAEELLKLIPEKYNLYPHHQDGNDGREESPKIEELSKDDLDFLDYLHSNAYNLSASFDTEEDEVKFGLEEGSDGEK